MSKWGSIGKPLTTIMVLALVGISLISFALIFTSYQTALGKLSLYATNNFKNELSEEADHIANIIEFRLKTLEGLTGASAASFALNPDENNPIRTGEILKILDSSRLRSVVNVARIDRDGVVTQSIGVSPIVAVGEDVSDQRYFELATVQNRTIFQQTSKGEGMPYLVLSIPVYQQLPAMVEQPQEPTFDGELALFIDPNILSSAVLDELSLKKGVDHILLVEKNGIILYDSKRELQLLQVQENALLDYFGPQSHDTISKIFDGLLNEGREGLAEYVTSDNTKGAISYSPIFVDDKIALGVALFGPSEQSEPLGGILDEQRDLLVLGTSLIIAAPGIFIAFILIINRRLVGTVDTQENKIVNQLQELQVAYEKLKETDILKDEFINIAAHELRTPVLPIILSAENLSDEMPDNSKIQSILRNAKRISKLTNDILDVSRIESNSFKLQKQQTNVRKLIDDLVQDFSLKIPHELEVTIKTDFSKLPPDLESVLIDKSRIIQVIGNLIDNAINFTERGTITVRVEFVRGDSNNSMRITVIDPGLGIDPEIKDRLFGKFITKSLNARGTGLGLYLSKAIVEAHGGMIGASSNPDGKGSIFSFTLPIT